MLIEAVGACISLFIFLVLRYVVTVFPGVVFFLGIVCFFSAACMFFSVRYMLFKKVEWVCKML